MYAGHFAAGLALKAKEPTAPMWGILIGVGLLDLLFGPFVLLGLERVSVTPGMSPGFRLDHIDWSHSLLMSLVWAAFFGALFLRWGWWLVELGVVLAAGLYYVRKARSSDDFGRRPLTVLAVVLVLHVLNSPWMSPL